MSETDGRREVEGVKGDEPPAETASATPSPPAASAPAAADPNAAGAPGVEASAPSALEPESPGASAEGGAAADGPRAPAIVLAATPSLAATAAADAGVERQLARLSRRGFLTLAAGGAGAALGWRWLLSRPGDSGQPWPFRRALQMNEALWEALWDPTRLAPTYPRSAAAKNPRVNGHLGLDPKADPAAWKLAVEGAAAGPLALALADVQALPAHDLVSELRCVEGWTIVVHWTGARLADFIAAYPPAGRDGAAADLRRRDSMPPFLALETPGRGYYVGLDMQSALHPQTLLAYAINGQPLSWDHGAPLRLVAPMKYGVKNLKRIGTLRYSFVRPTDFWYEHGYDWYLGH
jgi:DMSO/TMAO reductase YedYZ molybdopterin-dependent catalytic subunit